jgi:hypothetical protein
LNTEHLTLLIHIYTERKTSKMHVEQEIKRKLHVYETNATLNAFKIAVRAYFQSADASKFELLLKSSPNTRTLAIAMLMQIQSEEQHRIVDDEYHASMYQEKDNEQNPTMIANALHTWCSSPPHLSANNDNTNEQLSYVLDTFAVWNCPIAILCCSVVKACGQEREWTFNHMIRLLNAHTQRDGDDDMLILHRECSNINEMLWDIPSAQALVKCMIQILTTAAKTRPRIFAFLTLTKIAIEYGNIILVVGANTIIHVLTQEHKHNDIEAGQGLTLVARLMRHHILTCPSNFASIVELPTTTLKRFEKDLFELSKNIVKSRVDYNTIVNLGHDCFYGTLRSHYFQQQFALLEGNKDKMNAELKAFDVWYSAMDQSCKRALCIAVCNGEYPNPHDQECLLLEDDDDDVDDNEDDDDDDI